MKNKSKLVNNSFIRNKTFILLYLIIILFIQALTEVIISNITLKINGIGLKNIFSSSQDFNKNYYPTKVYINKIEQDIVQSSYYFNETNNFVELIWDKKIDNCYDMFRECSDIIELDLSKFNSSEISIMNNMFRDCTSLISLNLENFDTSKINYFGNFFKNCKSLISLNLSSFNTPLATDFGGMFENCISLTSLNLSNFDVSKGEKLWGMFGGSTNLEYINMENFDKNSLGRYEFQSMVTGLPENIVVCTKDNNNKILEAIRLKKCYVIECSLDWKSKQKKYIPEINSCTLNCRTNTQYPYENNGICVNKCDYGFSKNDKNKCKCQLEKCSLCTSISLKYELWIECDENFYQKENDETNIGDYFNCYERIDGYYLDDKDNFFKKRFNICETCD